MHLEVFSLFWSVWSNPQSTMFQIIKYLLTTCEDNSRTWSIHIRHLCRKYKMKDPLVLLQEPAWSKQSWKTYTNTMVISHHEKKLREDASTNSKMGFLNVSLSGLKRKPHHILEGIFSTYEVQKLRIHVKMLCQDYLTYGTLAKQSAVRATNPVSGHCRACSGIWDDVRHILCECDATQEARDKVFPKLEEFLKDFEPCIIWADLHEDKTSLTQFSMDPCSFSLPCKFKLPLNHPHLATLLSYLRDLCFCCHTLRTKALTCEKMKVFSPV